MSNPYYSNTGYPQFRAPGKSEDMRAELKRIEGGMERLPDPIMPNQPVFGNLSGTGMMMKDKESAKALLDLDKVDNTSDADKPISTETAAALETKADAAETAAALETKADAAETAAAISFISKSMVPVGTIIPYMGGYFSGSGNTGFTSVWGNNAASLNARFNEDGWYVCDGAMLNLPGSPFFDGVNRYLPNLTDDRFVMGSTSAGGVGGSNATEHAHTISHTHTMAHTHSTANHTLTTAQIPSHNHVHNGFVHVLGTGYGHDNSPQHLFAGVATSGGYTGSSGAHNHGNTGGASTSTTSGASTASSGSASLENRPKFISCLYLMKVI